MINSKYYQSHKKSQLKPVFDRPKLALSILGFEFIYVCIVHP